MNFLKKHLQSVQESYLAHLKFGITAGIICLFLGILSIVHAVFPFILPGRPEKIYKYLDTKLVKPRLARIEQVRKQ